MYPVNYIIKDSISGMYLMMSHANFLLKNDDVIHDDGKSFIFLESISD